MISFVVWSNSTFLRPRNQFLAKAIILNPFFSLLEKLVCTPENQDYEIEESATLLKKLI